MTGRPNRTSRSQRPGGDRGGGHGEGCYDLSGLGSSTGATGDGGTGSGCKEISYSSFYCEPGEPPKPSCGDGKIEGDEQCDPPGRINEKLICNDACQIAEVPEPEPEPICGNGEVEAGESCDPPGQIDKDLVCDEKCQIVKAL